MCLCCDVSAWPYSSATRGTLFNFWALADHQLEEKICDTERIQIRRHFCVLNSKMDLLSLVFGGKFQMLGLTKLSTPVNW